MLIMNQSKDAVTNLNNSAGVYVKDNAVMAVYNDGSDAPLGTYESEARAKEVLMELAESFAADFCVYQQSAKGTIIDGNRLYIMPEA